MVQYLINEKVRHLMLNEYQNDDIDADTKEWVDFLSGMNQCMDAAKGLKSYLGTSIQICFGKPDINIPQLDYLFFMRKNRLIENLLAELNITAEAVSKNLSPHEREPFFIWKTELEKITEEFKLQINKMKKYEKSKS